ncbi:hypothetical protein [Nocardioides sp.]|uniref:hypothetical protein n=1 Tax=Nocardioides sp. TaxID=35761 RepID=UPI002C64289B|nr:hypothetical protein [Nocardioides sp.]HXH79049.1 hypothetical protein [Nocardioides sp.]
MTHTVAPTRRTFIRAAAWTTPVVMVVAASPAFATSHPPVIVPDSVPDVTKCPGRSVGGADYSYVFSFTLTGTPDTFTVTSLFVAGVEFDVARILISGSTVHVRTVSSTNSADSDGNGTVVYTSNGETYTFTFDYDGRSHPNHNLCEATL